MKLIYKPCACGTLAHLNHPVRKKEKICADCFERLKKSFPKVTVPNTSIHKLKMELQLTENEDVNAAILFIHKTDASFSERLDFVMCAVYGFQL